MFQNWSDNQMLAVDQGEEGYPGSDYEEYLEV